MLKIPSSKHDLLSAEAIVASDWEKVEVLMPDLFEWTQDPNWPVAQVLYPYFAVNGDCVVEYVISVLNGSDTEWKYSLLVNLVPHMPKSSIALLSPHLKILSSQEHPEFEILVFQIFKKIMN